VPPYFATSQTFTRSDQIVFAQAGIPAVLVMEGLDYRHTKHEQGWQRFLKWGEQLYHTPADDLQQELNWDAAQQHAQVLLALAYALASDTVAPEWKAGAPFIHARLQTRAEKR